MGVQSSDDWIKNFNIGTTMHISPLSYDEFTFFGDFTYEISKNQIEEKVQTNSPALAPLPSLLVHGFSPLRRTSRS